jgi:hypothetical protein
MDSRFKKEKCQNCGDLFLPDCRNRGRQIYCFKPACRKASKTASQKRWLSKPENQNYFCGADNVQRARRWRRSHPGYRHCNGCSWGRLLQPGDKTYEQVLLRESYREPGAKRSAVKKRTLLSLAHR